MKTLLQKQAEKRVNGLSFVDDITKSLKTEYIMSSTDLNCPTFYSYKSKYMDIYKYYFHDLKNKYVVSFSNLTTGYVDIRYCVDDDKFNYFQLLTLNFTELSSIFHIIGDIVRDYIKETNYENFRLYCPVNDGWVRNKRMNIILEFIKLKFLDVVDIIETDDIFIYIKIK